MVSIPYRHLGSFGATGFGVLQFLTVGLRICGIRDVAFRVAGLGGFSFGFIVPLK